MWTLSQRRALIALAVVAWIALVVRAICWPVYVGDSPPDSSVPPTLIDPNTAPAAVLETIPGLGPVRAAAVIAFRDQYTAAHPGHPAFSRPDDLMLVKGIGPATMEKLRPYLMVAPQPNRPDSR